MKKLTFVAWVKFDRRSDLVAKHLGADIHYVAVGKHGSIWQAPFRYIIQAFQTWRILYREKPDIVLTQTPPLFAAVAIYMYLLFFEGEFVIDAHSATFLYTAWAQLSFIHRFLSKRALTTIVPNDDLQEFVTRWGGTSHRLGFTPDEYPPGEVYPMQPDAFNVAAICSFSGDEPVKEIISAARMAPDVHFYVTGNYKLAPPGSLDNTPANCHFTGYVSNGQYIGLLRGADAVMDLTTWEHTLLMGGYEAVSIGKPFITSQTNTLCRYFPIGTVHVDNTARGIFDGVRRTQAHLGKMQDEIVHLKDRLNAEWDADFGQLQHFLHAGP